MLYDVEQKKDTVRPKNIVVVKYATSAVDSKETGFIFDLMNK